MFAGKPALVAEIGYMAANGLSPMRALQAATRNAAQVNRVGAKLGTLEPGKLADIIAVGGDPLAGSVGPRRRPPGHERRCACEQTASTRRVNAARRLPLGRVDVARVGQRPRAEIRLGETRIGLALRLKRVRRLPPMVLVGAVMTALVLAAAVFAPLLAPHAYDDQDLSRSLLPPFWLPGGNPAYPLGTDFLGRDLLSRLVYGARTSLAVGALAVLLAGAIGVTLGLVAGYFGRVVDSVTMRLVDLQLALPPIVLAIAILTVVRAGSCSRSRSCSGVVGWVHYARVMRAQTLSLREREFVLAARVLGADSPRILRRHVLPNAMGPILVIATVNVSAMILAEASLSFLGVGVRPPTPAWGVDAQRIARRVPSGLVDRRLSRSGNRLDRVRHQPAWRCLAQSGSMTTPVIVDRPKSEFLDVNGLRLRYLDWRSGDKPPVLMLHGLAVFAHAWDHNAAALSDALDIVALDQRGHGESDRGPCEGYRTETYASDILGVGDALGWSRFSLVGQSMGGHNSMYTAAMHPERVERLVISDMEPTMRLDLIAYMRDADSLAGVRRSRRGYRRRTRA